MFCMFDPLSNSIESENKKLGEYFDLDLFCGSMFYTSDIEWAARVYNILLKTKQSIEKDQFSGIISKYTKSKKNNYSVSFLLRDPLTGFEIHWRGEEVDGRFYSICMDGLFGVGLFCNEKPIAVVALELNFLNKYGLTLIITQLQGIRPYDKNKKNIRQGNWLQ